MTKFVGLNIVGVYSNYLVIINMLNTFINTIYSSIISSLGNLVAKENPIKRLEIFKIMDFIGFVIYSFCGICLFNLFNPFIKIWAGESYLFSSEIVAIIVLNFYITGMRVPLGAIKSAAGVYSQDKYIPLIQSAINIIVSIILANYLGVMGVLIGTFVSSLLPAVHRPYVVYKNVFEKKPYEYYIAYVKKFIIFVLGVFLTNIIICFIKIDNPYLYLIITGIISGIIYLIFVFIIYRKTNELRYIRDYVKSIYLEVKK